MLNRRTLTAEFKVQAAHRVIDSDRSIAAVAQELNLGVQSMCGWVRDERRRLAAIEGTESEPMTVAEKAEGDSLDIQALILPCETSLTKLPTTYRPTNANGYPRPSPTIRADKRSSTMQETS